MISQQATKATTSATSTMSEKQNIIVAEKPSKVSLSSNFDFFGQ